MICVMSEARPGISSVFPVGRTTFVLTSLAVFFIFIAVIAPSTMTALVSELPGDLVHIVLEYAPGLALHLPASERIEVVRRMTKMTLSDERASLVLEQRDVGNRDFDDVTLLSDDTAWCNALHNAYSPRAATELLRLGQLNTRGRLNQFSTRALILGGDQGLALAQHLVQMDPENDVLCLALHNPTFIRSIVHPPTVHYLLRRLLDANDQAFDRRKTYVLNSPPKFAREFLGAAPSPLVLLVFQFYWSVIVWQDLIRYGWSYIPLLDALLSVHPNIQTLLIHLHVLRLMHNASTVWQYNIGKLISDVRPPGTFTFDWPHTKDATWGAVKFPIRYGTATQNFDSHLSQHAHLCGWIVDDWLAQASDANQWIGVSALFRAVSQHMHIRNKLIQGKERKRENQRQIFVA
jgi:hypothetical protein